MATARTKTAHSELRIVSTVIAAEIRWEIGTEPFFRRLRTAAASFLERTKSPSLNCTLRGHEGCRRRMQRTPRMICPLTKEITAAAKIVAKMAIVAGMVLAAVTIKLLRV